MGRPNLTKGIPRPNARGPRPHTWKVGPDELKRNQYLIWLQQKNQAQFRKEGWEFEFEDWLAMWGDKWELRGRTRGTYCMTRIDPFYPWTKDNVTIIERRAHSQRNRAERDIYTSLTLERKK